MGKVFVDITTSLDGYIAGPNDGLELPLGENGERLHEWIFGLRAWREPHGLEGGETNRDSEIVEESLADRGAVDRRRGGCSTTRTAGARSRRSTCPVFVLTHEAREPETKDGGTTFTFVTDGVESAFRQAKAAAGDRNILVAGGASTVQQFLKAGLVDEIQIHVTPLLLGGGVKLLDGLNDDDVKLEITRVVESPTVDASAVPSRELLGVRLDAAAFERQPGGFPVTPAAGIVAHVGVAELEQTVGDSRRAVAVLVRAVDDDLGALVGNATAGAIVQQLLGHVDRARQVRHRERDRRERVDENEVVAVLDLLPQLFAPDVGKATARVCPLSPAARRSG